MSLVVNSRDQDACRPLEGVEKVWFDRGAKWKAWRFMLGHMA